MIGLLFELIGWAIKLAVLAAVLVLKLLAGVYRAIEQGVHGYRVAKDPHAQREHSQGIAAVIFLSILGVLVLIGSLTGGSSAPDKDTSSSPKAAVAHVAQASDEQRRAHPVRITTPANGATYAGTMIESIRQQRALVHIRGRAAPGARVYVSGNADVSRASRDDAIVTVAANGHWGARINAYGCGRPSSSSEIDAGYKSSDGGGDKVTVRLRCHARTATARRRTPIPTERVHTSAHKNGAPAAAAPTTPAGTTCAQTPLTDFPVPPGDPRDRDGDGIACKS